MRHIMPRCPMQGTIILPRSGHNGQRHTPHQLPPAFPTRQGGQTICPGQPHKPRMGETHLQFADGINRIARAESGFYVRCHQLMAIHQPRDRLKPLNKRRHTGRCLQRIAGRDHKPHLIQPQRPQRPTGNGQMPFMRRIEGAPQQPDTRAPQVPRSWNSVLAAHPDQVRTCPVPSTSYRKVVSCSTPTGPRA